MRRFFQPVVAALLLAGHAACASAQSVDLALVMAVDVSESVDAGEYLLQHDGIARAFEDPLLVAAIAAGQRGAIEVAVLEWSDRDKQVVTVDWTRIGDATSAAGFAHKVRDSQRSSNGLTAIGDALLAARALFDSAPAPADRKLVDLSGDGMANIGPPVRETRDALVAAGITINGLAILASEPWLESYYDEYVIGGPGAFLLRAEDFSSFATAIHNKLLGEISGLMPAVPPDAERRLAAQIQYVLSGAKPLKPTDE
ncbi:MAG TPA: DUF1194 domain-containing protein [Stellaceae bacterium]|jgi:hypothetical protein|nr:DUF1194 domain-containing protein [Stellaceae bacterium]